MNNLVRRIRDLYSRDRYTFIQFLMLGAALLYAAAVFMYCDMENTVDNSNTMIYALRTGKLLDFYELSVERASTSYAANYNCIVYVLFALWQAPAYLIVSLAGKGYLNCPWAMLWSKLLVVLFSAAAAYYIYKIVMYTVKDRERSLLAVFLYYSSMTVFLPTFICAQLEAIPATFMLAGVFAYLKGDNKKFWLAFLIAAPFKMFSLMLALPLILAKEKNALKASLLWLSMSGLIIIENIVFRGSPVHKYALAAQSENVTEQMLGANIRLGKPIAVFFVLYIGLVIYSYIKENISNNTILYMSFFLWGTFAALSYSRSYWFFLAAPFMAVNICVHDRFIRYNALIETVGGVCYLLGFTAVGSSVFADEGLVFRLLLPGLMRVPEQGQLKYGSFLNYFTRLGLYRYAELFTTAYVSAILALLVLTLPALQKKDAAKPNTASPNIERWVLISRPVILAAMALLIVYGYTAKTNAVAFDTRELECSVCKADLISPKKDNTVTQDIVFKDDRKLDELILKFKNTHYHRSNMALLYVEIWDVEADRSVFAKAVGCSAVQNNAELTVDLRHTRVSSGKTYRIRLSGKTGNLWYYDAETMGGAGKTERLYTYLASDEEGGGPYAQELAPAEVNGKPQEGYLYFEIR